MNFAVRNFSVVKSLTASMNLTVDSHIVTRLRLCFRRIYKQLFNSSGSEMGNSGITHYKITKC